MKQTNRKKRLWILSVLLFAGVFMLGVTAFTAEAASCSHSYQNGFCSQCGGYEAALDSNSDGVYEIENAGELYWFAEQVNGGNADAGAILTADIDANPGYSFCFEAETGLVRVEKDSALVGYLGTGQKGTEHFTATASVVGAVYDTKLSAVTAGSAYNAIRAIRLWTPIGNGSASYTGSFDGGSHTVSGLYFHNTSTDYAALFGGLYSGDVSNVKVINSCFLGRKNIAGIVGYSAMSSVTGCSFAGAVVGGSHIGGVVGYAYASEITRCSSTAMVLASDYIAGGIAGEIAEYSGISNCYNTGVVSGGREKTGGIVGYNYGGSVISDSYNTGTVTGEYFVGGVVGSSAASAVTNCYYQVGCATDGNGYAQNGVGTCAKGSALTDTQGCTAGMDEKQFASGQVAYTLQENQSTQIWGQNLDNGEQVQISPVLSGAVVYSCYGCDGSTLSYTNDPSLMVKPHSMDENGVCGTCGTDTPVVSWNITLADAIGINFVMNAADMETVACYIGETELETAVTANSDGTCTVSVFLAAAQMTDAVTLSINGNPWAKTYSIREYADVILAGDHTEDTKILVKQMLSFGGASQLYFQYNTDNLANAGIEAAKAAVPEESGTVTVEGSVSGIRFYGATLVHRSKTAVRFYFSAESIEGITFKVNDVEYMPVAKNGLYYIEIGSIHPQNFDADILVQVSDGTESLRVGYAPLDYIIRMYRKADSSDALKALVQALYGYYLAAENYT